MKFVIFVILFAGVSCYFPPSGPSYGNQLTAFSDLASYISSVTGLDNNLSGYVSSTGDTSVFTIGIEAATSALYGLADAISDVSEAISSGGSLSGVNSNIEDWAAAEAIFYAALSALSSGSGSYGSYADLNDHASSVLAVASAVNGLAGAINGIPGSAAVLLGNTAKQYGLPNALNNLADSKVDLAGVIKAVSTNSQLIKVGNALNQEADAYYNLYDALVNAANK